VKVKNVQPKPKATGKPYFAPPGEASHQQRLQDAGEGVDAEAMEALQAESGMGLFDPPETTSTVEEQLLLALERTERSWGRQRIVNALFVMTMAVLGVAHVLGALR
jgi:hypothetical protein